MRGVRWCSAARRKRVGFIVVTWEVLRGRGGDELVKFSRTEGGTSCSFVEALPIVG